MRGSRRHAHHFICSDAVTSHRRHAVAGDADNAPRDIIDDED